jgi:predicted RNase H-like HicB family nuclease
MSPQQRIFEATVHHEDGSYWAELPPALPGCFASGATMSELRLALAEAVALYLADEDAPLPAVDVEPSPGPRVLVGVSA